MSNLFDTNGRASEALIGGAGADTAFGYPQLPTRSAGLKFAPGRVPELSPDDTPLARSRAGLQRMMQAQQPQPNADPVIGYDPSSDTYWSGGKTFNGSNLSDIDSADRAGLLDVDNSGKVPPGMQSVRASQIRTFKEREAQRRGLGSAIMEGVQQVGVGLAEYAPSAAKSVAFGAPRGSALEKFAGDAATYMEEALGPYQPDVYGRGAMSEYGIKGARALGTSAPSMAAGLVGSATGPLGAAAAGSATGVLFGGAQGWDTLQKALKAGKSHEEAMALARETAAAEGFGEALGNVVGGALLRGPGKWIGGKLVADRGAGMVAGTAWKGPAAASMAANAAIQGGTEFAQSAAVAGAERREGVSTADPWAEGTEAFKVGVAMAVLMAPFGGGVAYMQAAQRRQDQLTIVSNTASPEERNDAADRIVSAIADIQGPAAAKQWATEWKSRDASQVADGASKDLLTAEESITAKILGLSTEDDSAADRRVSVASGALPFEYTPPGGDMAASVESADDVSRRMAPDAPLQQVETRPTAAGEIVETAPGVYSVPVADRPPPVGRVLPRPAQADSGPTQQVETYVPPRSIEDIADAFPTRESAAEELGRPLRKKDTLSSLHQEIADKLIPKEEAEPSPASGLAFAPARGGSTSAQAERPWTPTVSPSAVTATPGAAAVAPTPTTSTSEPFSADEEIPGLAPIMENLEAKTKSSRVEVEGRVTADQRALKGAARSIQAGRSKDGSTKPPVIYNGTKGIDAEATAELGPLMSSWRDAALRIIDLARGHYDRTSNKIPTPAKADNIKRKSGETPAEFLVRQNQRAASMAEEAAHSTRTTQVRLVQALDELVKATRGGANANALIAVLKKRIHDPLGTDPNAADRKTDVMLSRAWRDYINGVLDVPENVAVVRSEPTRLSDEKQARSDAIEKKVPGSADPQPLEAAATDGYSPRMIRQNKGETDKAYNKRVEKVLDANRGVLGVLAYFQRHGGVFEGTLASALRRALEGAATVPKVVFSKGEANPRYDPKTDSIHISSTSSPEVAMHEILHSALQWYVLSHPNHAAVKKLEQALKTVLAYDRAQLSPRAQEVYDVLAKLSKRNKTDAILELISYGNTLREFNVALSKIPSTDKGGFLGAAQAVWKHITEMVQHLLGVRNTVANDVLDSTINLLESAGAEGAGRTSTAVSGGKVMKSQVSSPNILHAAISSSTPEQNAVQPGAKPNLKYAKNMESLWSKMSTEVLFRALGWDRVPDAMAKGASKLADTIRDKTPGLAKWVQAVNAEFTLPVPLRDSMAQYKTDKHISFGVTSLLANYIKTLPSAESVKVFQYLDGDKTALAEGSTTREVADLVYKHFKEYVAAIRHEPTRRRFQDQDNKFSDLMVFPSKTKDIASRSLGARKLGALIGSRREKKYAVDVHFAEDAEGNPKLYDPMVRVVSATEKTVDGHPEFVGFYAQSVIDADGLPSSSVVEKNGLQWRHLRRVGAGEHEFVASRNAEQALKDGKAEEVANALTNTMTILANQYASNRLMDAMADQGTERGVVFDSHRDLQAYLGPENKISSESIVNIGDPEAQTASMKSWLRSSHQWVRIPKGDAYGAMSGKIVQGSVWSAIEDMSDRRPLHNFDSVHAAMRVFKKTHTVYNPGTHLGNAGTNVTLALMHDIPLTTVYAAAKLMWQFRSNPDAMSPFERSMVMKFVDSGAQLGDYSSIEVKAALFDAMKAGMDLNEPKGVIDKTAAFLRLEAEKSKALQKLARAGRAGKTAAERMDELAVEMYSAEDNVFRMAAFMARISEMSNNLGGPEALGDKEYRAAGDYAREAFLDYDIDSRAVKMLRASAMPFISWTYAIMPVLGKIALHKPWKLANVFLGYYALQAAMEAAAGGDDDELRKAGPEYIRNRILGTNLYMHIRVPGMGDEKNPVFFKLGQFIPLGNVADASPNGFMGVNNWPAQVSPTGPFITAIVAAVGGVDPYTGKPLAPPTADAWEKLWAASKTIGKQFVPPWTGPLAQRAGAGEQLPDKGRLGGDAFNDIRAARELLGVRLYQYNMEEAYATQGAAVKGIKAEFDKEIAKIARAQARYETPDWEAFNKRRDELLERRNERIKEARGE